METKLSKQEQIALWKDILASTYNEIDTVNQGLILDSGEIKPDIIDSAQLRKLEAQVRRYEAKIAELQGDLEINTCS